MTKQAAPKKKTERAACPDCGAHNYDEWVGTVHEAYVEPTIVNGFPELQCNSWGGEVDVACGECSWRGDAYDLVAYDKANDKSLDDE